MKASNRDGTPRTFIYAYRITESTYPAIEVGRVLFDARRDLVALWTVHSAITDDYTHFAGNRIGRLCSECYAIRGYISTYGHEGEHGRDAPRFNP